MIKLTFRSLALTIGLHILLFVSSVKLYSEEKTCSLDVLAFTFADSRASSILSNTVYRERIYDFLITLSPRHGRPSRVTFSGKNANPHRLNCGEYSYRLSCDGFRYSEGNIELVLNRHTALVVVLSLGSIVEDRTHAKVAFHVPAVKSLRDDAVEVWLTALDGSGTFGTSPSYGDSASIEVRHGIYTITVFNRNKAMIVETVYLPAHDMSVRIDLEKREIQFDESQ